jgi:hypothetical protein
VPCAAFRLAGLIEGAGDQTSTPALSKKVVFEKSLGNGLMIRYKKKVSPIKVLVLSR